MPQATRPRRFCMISWSMSKEMAVDSGRLREGSTECLAAEAACGRHVIFQWLLVGNLLTSSFASFWPIRYFNPRFVCDALETERFILKMPNWLASQLAGLAGKVNLLCPNRLRFDFKFKWQLHAAASMMWDMQNTNQQNYLSAFFWCCEIISAWRSVRTKITSVCRAILKHFETIKAQNLELAKVHTCLVQPRMVQPRMVQPRMVLAQITLACHFSIAYSNDTCTCTAFNCTITNRPIIDIHVLNMCSIIANLNIPPSISCHTSHHPRC